MYIHEYLCVSTIYTRTRRRYHRYNSRSCKSGFVYRALFGGRQRCSPANRVCKGEGENKRTEERAEDAVRAEREESSPRRLPTFGVTRVSSARHWARGLSAHACPGPRDGYGGGGGGGLLQP